MIRRLGLSLVLLVCVASLASAKFKQEDQDYLDEKFQSVLAQIQQLKAQVDTLATQLQQVAQNQSDLQQTVMRQQNSLSDVEHALSGLRAANEEHLTSLRNALAALQGEQQKNVQAVNALANQISTVGQQQASGAPAAKTPAPPVVQGYITVVDKDGTSVTVSLGSGQGLHSGSKLALYKGSDNATANRVGVLQVGDVIDTGNAHAKVVTLNEGVHPEFGDIVIRVSD